MIQDTAPHQQPVPASVSQTQIEEESLNIHDFLTLCLANWKWFILSIFVMSALAVLYIMHATPVYTRTASVLIKDDTDGSSMQGIAAQISDLGLINGSTNVNNELLAFQSPALMGEVISRLGLTKSYTYHQGLKRLPLYGDSLPVKVEFLSLSRSENAYVKVTPDGKGKVTLSDYRLKTEDIDGDDQTVEFGDTVVTPIGKMLVIPGPNYSPEFTETISVNKMSMTGAIENYTKETAITLADDNASVIDITVKDTDIQRATDIINTLINVYNEKWVEDKNLMAVTTSSFINERLNVIEQELGNVDNDISSFKSEHLLPDLQLASTMYMQQSSENTKQEFELTTQKAIATFLRDYVVETTDAGRLLPANSGLESQGIEKQIQEYNTLQLERDKLVSNSGTSNPLVQDYDRNLKAMRTAINSSLDNLLVSINAQLKTLAKAESTTNSQIASSPSQAKYLLSVERQQKVKESLYLFLLQKREENELSRAFTAYNTRVITPPFGTDKPTSPVTRNILLIALLLGTILPAVVIFIEENVNIYVRGRGDLEGMITPYIGEIPLSGSAKNVNKFTRRLTRLKHGIFGGKELKPSAPILVVKPKGRNMINESFRSIRTSIEFMTNSIKTTPVMMMTSFNAGSGKSFISLNIGAVLAIRKKGVKILAIDLDLRRASLSAAVNSPGIGIADYLSGADISIESTVCHTECPGLDIIPVGSIPPNPSELLYTERMKQIMAWAKENYDYVMLDCPPVEIVTDASIINQFVDITLFVVRVGLLDRRMLAQLDRYYAEQKYRNLAVILNGTMASANKYSSYYNKNYYHSDYYHSDE